MKTVVNVRCNVH